MDDRRKVYREEVTTAVEQYQEDSRKYRRIHNGLQSLIMIGSASTTTIAALDAGLLPAELTEMASTTGPRLTVTSAGTTPPATARAWSPTAVAGSPRRRPRARPSHR